MIVTGARVAFYRKGFFGDVLETIPLRSLTSIERKSFMGHRVLRLHTSHDALEFEYLNKEAYEAVVAAVEAGRNAPSGGDRKGETSASPLDKLRQLGELKVAGLITEPEYEKKKAELLEQV